MKEKKDVITLPIEGSMCLSKEFKTALSVYHVREDAFIIELKHDADADFVMDALENCPNSVNVAIITVDTRFEIVTNYAVLLAEALQHKGLHVICLCNDYSEPDENGYYTEDPVELSLQELKDKANTVIITSPEVPYIETIEMLLAYGTPATEAGYAYFNTLFVHEESDLPKFVRFLLFDSMFHCPIYAARKACFQIEAGSSFDFSESEELNDIKVLRSIIEDHLDANCQVSISTKLLPGDRPFGIYIKVIYSDFDQEIFKFTEKGVWDYPEIGDRLLKQRMKLLLQGKVYEKKKRHQYLDYRHSRREPSKNVEK